MLGMPHSSLKPLPWFVSKLSGELRARRSFSSGSRAGRGSELVLNRLVFVPVQTRQTQKKYCMEGQISPARLGFLMTIFLPNPSEVQTAKMSMDLDESVPISDFHAQQQPEATCVPPPVQFMKGYILIRRSILCCNCGSPIDGTSSAGTFLHYYDGSVLYELTRIGALCHDCIKLTVDISQDVQRESNLHFCRDCEVRSPTKDETRNENANIGVIEMAPTPKYLAHRSPGIPRAARFMFAEVERFVESTDYRCQFYLDRATLATDKGQDHYSTRSFPGNYTSTDL